MSEFQYHVLVKGFVIRKKDDRSPSHSETDLRHYRYNVSTTKYESVNGKDRFSDSKSGTLLGSFPVNDTMVLVEEAKE